MASSEDAAAGRPDWIGLAGVSLAFGHIVALRDVDFRLEPGEIHALVGNHNDGKSTLCRVLAGLAVPDSGCVRIDGAARCRYGVREASLLGVEYLGDSTEIFPHLSVLENMVIGTYGKGGAVLAPAADRAGVAGWLSGFGLEGSLGRKAADLSLEDRLLVKVLGCLYKNPRLLILDETLEQFTPERRTLLVAELRRRAETGMTILWATHSLDEALEWANRLTVLRNGRPYLTIPAEQVDRRSLIRMTYSSTGGRTGASSEDFGSYYNLVRYSEVLLQHLPSAVLVMDASERLQFVNASALRLLSLDESGLPGLPAAEALGRDNPGILDMVRASLRDRAEVSVSGVRFVGGTESALVDVRVLAVADDLGRLSVMLILDDVSEREAMRKQLAVAHNLSSIGMLAAGVAHEVNNPLESIGNYISYLLRRTGPDETGDILARIQKEADCIRDIVTNLVMFSGKGERNGLPVRLDEAIRDIVDMLGYNSRYGDIEIECDFPDPSPFIRADPKEFRQILLNLIRNGMEAMPDGGCIAISVAGLEGGRVRIAVRDYGGGIDPDLAVDNELFLPFVSGKNGADGTQGLGLSIVYGLVKKWGGEISVEAAKPGTRFILDFPLLDRDGSEAR